MLGLRAGVVARMGRRSAKIAGKKGKTDAKKAKMYGMMGKLIAVASRAGGPDPIANHALADAIKAAQRASVPKEIIDRNVKKGGDKDAADFQEVTFEAYGAGGVGFVAVGLTDNTNRTSAEVRSAVTKGGGKNAESGSVLFSFSRKGVLRVQAGPEEEEVVLEAALEAGAEDVEPELGGGFRVLTEVEDWGAVRDALVAGGALDVDHGASGIELLPQQTVAAASPEAGAVNEAIFERLMQVDDIDAVYSTMAEDDAA